MRDRVLGAGGVEAQLHETRAQVLLEHLAHCVPGKRIDDFQLLGALLDGETLKAAVLTDIVQLHLDPTWSTTTATTRSPVRLSGSPSTAASATAG